MSKRFITVAAVIASACTAHAALAQPSGDPPSAASLAPLFAGEKHFTRPSRDSTMGFTFPAELAELRVRGGDVVKKGDVLIRANASEQEQQRNLQKLLAETDLDIRRAQAALDQAQVEFKAQEQIVRERSGSQVEYDRAKAQLSIRQVELEIARFQQVQQQVNLAFRQAIVDRFELRAPFDGRIDMVVGDVGEVKKDGEPVIRVVDTNPLWIDVPARGPETITLNLKGGDPAWVLLDLPEDPRVYVGKVIEVSAEVDPRSATRRVRVELPNPKDWPSGVTCWVRFTEPTGDLAPRIVANVDNVASDPAAGETLGARK